MTAALVALLSRCTGEITAGAVTASYSEASSVIFAADPMCNAKLRIRVDVIAPMAEGIHGTTALEKFRSPASAGDFFALMRATVRMSISGG